MTHVNFLTGHLAEFPVAYEAIGGFFTISGFLMYPHYKRHSGWAPYMRGRASRILPPYMLVVLGCAAGLVAVSSLSSYDYYSSRGFWDYLAANLSFMNWLHPDLPGVFTGPEFRTAAVNPSLWTMKVDWGLYVSVPLFAWITCRLRRPGLAWAALAVAALSICYQIAMSMMLSATGREIFEILSRQVFGQAYFFFFGMALYFIRNFVKQCLAGTFLTGAALFLISGIDGPWLQIILHPAGTAMMVISLSLIPGRIPWLHHKENIAYEMYLFHFPVIQLCVYFGIDKLGEWATAGVVFPVTILVAWGAHHLTLLINSLYKSKYRSAASSTEKSSDRTRHFSDTSR